MARTGSQSVERALAVLRCLAASDDEWFEKTSALIEDAGLRRRMGLAGRKTIEERFSARVWVPKVREIFTEAAASRRA